MPTSEFPRTPKATAATMQRSYEIIQSLKPGVGARVPVPEGKHPRGLKSSLSKAAKALDVDIELLDASGYVWVKLAGDG